MREYTHNTIMFDLIFHQGVTQFMFTKSHELWSIIFCLCHRGHKINLNLLVTTQIVGLQNKDTKG